MVIGERYKEAKGVRALRKLTYKQPGKYMGWDITMYEDYIRILMRTPLGDNQVVLLPIKIFNKMIKSVKKEIGMDILEEVLRKHLKSHIVVARDQLTDKDKMTIFKEFDEAIEKQLEKLDGDSIPKCQFCGRKMINYNGKWICGHGCVKPALGNKDYKDGETLVEGERGITSMTPNNTDSIPSEPNILSSFHKLITAEKPSKPKYIDCVGNCFTCEEKHTCTIEEKEPPDLGKKEDEVK